MKNIFKIRGIRSIACLSIVVMLSGCSSLPDFPSFSFFDDDEEQIPQQSMPSAVSSQERKYEEHLAEWQQAKVNVNKVTNLTVQVNELTAKVNSLESNQVKLEQELKLAKKSNTQPAQYSNGNRPTNHMKGFGVQLFSVSNKSKIESSWDIAMETHPNELSGLQRIYEKVTVNGRIYYRVKAGSFNSMSQAKQLCSKIQSSGSVCIPTLFIGQPF